MKTKTINLYSFAELSEEAQQKALDNLRDINVDFEDLDTKEDAQQIGLRIFELSDHRENKGEFETNAENCANAILLNHGPDCETYKTAQKFLAEYLPAKKLWDEKEEDGELVNDGFPFEHEDAAQEIEHNFLQEILEDYRIMRNKNYEYFTGDEAVKETIEANEYFFTEDGKLEN
jgi:hypothetical protein